MVFYQTFVIVYWEFFDVYFFVSVFIVVDGVSQIIQLDLMVDFGWSQYL